MTISIIIPVYGVESYIKECLYSVLKQKCKSFNLECILVDDCSPDHSMDIAREVIAGYHGADVTFRIVEHEHNRGLSVARNSGIQAATGEFLYFLDSDDLLSDDALHSLYAACQQHPGIDVVMGNTYWESEGRGINSLSSDNVESARLLDNRQVIVRTMLLRQINRQAPNKLIRRSFILDNNLFFDEGILYEDVTWSYRMYLCASSVFVIPNVTYIYKNNPTSIVNTVSACAPHMLRSFTFISDYVLHHPPFVDNRDFYTLHRMFVFHWLMIAVDIKEKYSLSDEGQLNSLCRELIVDAFRRFRPVMGIFFLTLVAPLKYLTKFKLFRYNLSRMAKIVYRLS